MRVLFVGFGDIARRSAPLFLAAGWQVTGLRRSPVEVPDVTMVAGDCRNAELLAQLVAEHDVVVASLTPDSYTEEGYRAAYIEPAQALRDSIAGSASAPKLVLWVSSTSVYGQGDGGWVDESSHAEPDGYSGRALLEGERIVADLPVASAAIRFSGIYGPGRERMIRQVQAGQCAPEHPVQWSNRIHADDCAGVIFHLAQHFFAGREWHPLYIATDCEPVALHEVHRWLAEQLGVPIQAVEASGGRGNRRCSNQRLLDSGYQFIYPGFREGYRALLAARAVGG